MYDSKFKELASMYVGHFIFGKLDLWHKADKYMEENFDWKYLELTEECKKRVSIAIGKEVEKPQDFNFTELLYRVFQSNRRYFEKEVKAVRYELEFWLVEK